MASIVVSALAFAQVSLAGPFGLGGGSVRVGFHRGADYTNTLGAKTRLEGFQVGLDLPVVGLPLTGVQVSLSPTVVFGGSHRQGSDTDGMVYRLMATAKTGVPASGYYAFGGVGYGWSNGRGGTVFNTKTSLLFQAGLGMDIGTGPLPTKPFVQASYVWGEDQFRGLSFEVGMRF